jgi:DNA-binding transcriptional MerR regulator
VGEVAWMFQVDPEAIRQWERDGILKSFRTSGGHRRYRAEDLDPMLRRAR